MEQTDMINKLHEKANISKEEARDALERADWDMLEALLILEKEGKIKPLTASMTTIEDKNDYEEVRRTASDKKNSRFEQGAQGFFDKIAMLIRKSMENAFVVERKGEEILYIPVLIMIIVTLSMFHFTLGALLIGLFFDCKYSIEKKDRRR